MEGKKPKYIVKKGDLIQVVSDSKPYPEDIPLLYMRMMIYVVNKPKGWLSIQPGSPNKT